MFSILVKYKQYARINEHCYGLVRLNQTFGPPEARSFLCVISGLIKILIFSGQICSVIVNVLIFFQANMTSSCFFVTQKILVLLQNE